MCNALPFAALLLILLAALTVIRMAKATNPNSDMLCSLINDLAKDSADKGQRPAKTTATPEMSGNLSMTTTG